MSDETYELFFNRALESVIRLALLFFLAYWAFQVMTPFIAPVLWGVIIAVAVYPLYERLDLLLGGRPKTAAMLFVILALGVLLVPVLALTGSLVESGQQIASDISSGKLRIPPPNDSVMTWPLVGDKLFELWTLAATNLEAALQQAQPQLEAIGSGLLSIATSAGLGVLMFLLSIIISGAILANAGSGTQVVQRLFVRLAPEQGESFASLSVQTVRGVAAGVLGVAFIQALLAGVGFIVAGVPAAGLWALLVLLLGVVQLSPGIVIIPIIVYVFSEAETMTAVLFAAYSIPVMLADNLLKPLLMGRNVKAPMLIIFLGAIGGFIMAGIIGLFIGGVVLVLAYEMTRAWLYHEGTSGEG